MRAARLAVTLLLLVASSAQAGVFRLLDDDAEAAQARVDLFQQAHTEVNALYFLARNDRVTLAALALMRDAKRRGVATRLIVDANFQHIPKSVLGYLRDEGVQIKVYHPMTLRHPLWLFYRMHEKVVIVDGQRYITGGRNLAESYFGLASKRRNYVDRDVYVEGESAAEAQHHFENLWSSRHVADLKVSVSAEEKAAAEKMLQDAVDALVTDGFIQLDTNHDWSAGQKNVASVEFLHDPLVPGAGPRVGTRLTEVLEKATESIVLESPYFVPSRALIKLIDEKRAQGVKVTVVTNSLTSNDGFLPHVAYLKYRRHLVRAGVDVREYKGPDCLHAKSAVVDGHLALVGSYNIDPRSENLNTEVMAVADDVDAARDLKNSIDAHAANAFKIGARRERGAWPTTRAMSFRMWAARLLLPFVEGQL
jgi:putative cardiolipin synthase